MPLYFTHFKHYYLLDYEKQSKEEIEVKKLRRRWNNNIDLLKKHHRKYKEDVMRTGEPECFFI